MGKLQPFFCIYSIIVLVYTEEYIGKNLKLNRVIEKALSRPNNKFYEMNSFIKRGVESGLIPRKACYLVIVQYFTITSYYSTTTLVPPYP